MQSTGKTQYCITVPDTVFSGQLAIPGSVRQTYLCLVYRVYMCFYLYMNYDMNIQELMNNQYNHKHNAWIGKTIRVDRTLLIHFLQG
jgi:hypothetical protein